jgi:hypothetical protein
MSGGRLSILTKRNSLLKLWRVLTKLAVIGYMRRASLVQVEGKDPELCFTYAPRKKTAQGWQQGAPRGGGKTYVNMFPETLVKLVLKAISGDCEGSFEPAKSRLKTLS